METKRMKKFGARRSNRRSKFEETAKRKESCNQKRSPRHRKNASAGDW